MFSANSEDFMWFIQTGCARPAMSGALGMQGIVVLLGMRGAMMSAFFVVFARN